MKISALFTALAIVAIGVPAGAAVTVGGLTYQIGPASRATSYGPGFMAEKAAGEFIIIKMTIKNVGDKPADISASDFKLKRGSAEYDSSSVTMSSGDGFFLTKLNPGTQKTGTLVFMESGQTKQASFSVGLRLARVLRVTPELLAGEQESPSGYTPTTSGDSWPRLAEWFTAGALLNSDDPARASAVVALHHAALGEQRVHLAEEAAKVQALRTELIQTTRDLAKAFAAIEDLQAALRQQGTEDGPS